MKDDKNTPGIALLLGKPKEAPKEDAEEDDADPDSGMRDGGSALLAAVEAKDPDGIADAVRQMVRIAMKTEE